MIFVRNLTLVLFISGVFSSEIQAQAILETTVVTGKHFPESLQELAGSVSKIEEQALQTIGAKHFSDLTSLAPGTWISRGSGQEHLSAIRSPVFSGAGACAAFLMAEDEIPLRANGFCNVNELFDTHYEVAQNVEVFRGPNSTTFGSNALFGGINVALPQPGKNTAGSVQISTDEFQHTRASVQHSNKTYWLGASLLDDEGYRTDAGVNQQKFSFKQLIENRQLKITNAFTLNRLDQETAGYIEGQNAYKDKKRLRENENPEAWRDAFSLRAHSKWQWQTTKGEFNFTPWLRKNDMQFLMHFVPWQPVEENAHQSLGTNFLWRSAESSATSNSQFSGFFGAEIEHTSAELREYQNEPAPFNPDSFPVGIHYDYEVAALTAAVFAGLDWQISDKLKLEWQSRFDQIHYDYNNLTGTGSACAPEVTTCRFYRPADREDRFHFLSNKLSALFSFNEQHLGYLKLARGFRVPQASELYRLQAGQQSAELDEVELRSIEIGARGTFTFTNISYDFAVFRMDQTNSIFQDSERQYVSGSDTNHKGIEYSLHWQVYDQLSLHLSGTHALHQYSNSPDFLESSLPLAGKDIDTAPRNMFAAELQWQASPTFSFNYKLQKMGAYFTNPENTYSYEGHTISNLRLLYTPDAKLTLTISIDNLFDTRYADRADITFNTLRYFPGQERTSSISLRWNTRT